MVPRGSFSISNQTMPHAASVLVGVTAAVFSSPRDVVDEVYADSNRSERTPVRRMEGAFADLLRLQPSSHTPFPVHHTQPLGLPCDRQNDHQDL